MEPTVSESADVAGSAIVGHDSRVWHFAQIRAGAKLGSECVVGRGAYIGPDVVIGDRVKIQNYALVYGPCELESGVFVGPAAVLTNDLYPRAVDEQGRIKSGEDWSPVRIHVREGASLGAHSTCVAPVSIGRWALVGAGAVVVADVPDFALVVGVPARRIGWVGRAGVALTRDGESKWRCERTGETFVEEHGLLREAPS